MKAPLALVGLSVLLACSGPGTHPEPTDEGTIVTFAPVGDRAFLVEESPGALHERLRALLQTGPPDRATKVYANRWVQPPGWRARVEAFGEPKDGDLFARMGYPYRTNLVAPGTGVAVLAYSKRPPSTEVWQARADVRVSGRLEGYARRPPGVVILLDAEFTPATPESLAFIDDGNRGANSP